MTTVYNRAYLISSLYQSLIQQTNQNFEWLIVDDGSTDNLKKLYEQWISDEKRCFEMQYIYRENGGKHRAWNTGIQYAKGEYVFVVDSDDYLTDNAIQKVYKWIEQVQGDDSFAGVSGTKGRMYGDTIELLGKYPIGKKYVDASNRQRYYKKLGGDKAEIYRRDLLLKYPFPEFEGEKFCSEVAVFGRIARAGYKLRWFPDIICICEYLEDGLTNTVYENKRTHFKGYTYVMKYSGKYEQFPINILKIGKYATNALRIGYSIKEGARMIEVPIALYALSKMAYDLNEGRKKLMKNGRKN